MGLIDADKNSTVLDLGCGNGARRGASADRTALHFHLSESRAKRTEETAMDNLWLELKKYWLLYEARNENENNCNH